MMDARIMSTDPLRVCARVSSRSTAFATAWDDIEGLIKMAIEALKGQIVLDQVDAPRLVALERYDIAIFVVFDLFHHNYDPRNGHLAEHNDLPVYEVVFSRGKVSAAKSTEERKRYVNHQVQTLHNLNGEGSEPPFETDFSNGQRAHYGAPRVLHLNDQGRSSY